MTSENQELLKLYTQYKNDGLVALAAISGYVGHPMRRVDEFFNVSLVFFVDN